MQYKELESQVYTLLRSGRLAEAVILVAQHRTSFAGADRYDYLSLKANVQLLASPLNMVACADLVDKVLASPETGAITKLKTSLLGAFIADKLDDRQSWQGYIAKLNTFLPADPRFTGRALRVEAALKERQSAIVEALGLYEESKVWHLHNIGPYDERDRLCYLGITCSDLVRLHIHNGDIAAAQAAAETARHSIPADAYQRVYVPMSDIRLGLANDNLSEAVAALSEARAMLKKHPHGYAAHQFDELEAALLARQGCPDRAREALERLAEKGRLERDLPALQWFQALAVVSG